MNFMHALAHILHTLFDIIFPPSEDMLRVRHADERALCLHVAPRRTDAIESLILFSDPLVRACIHEAKFHENKKALRMLGIVLAQFLETLPVRETLLIPIPLSPARVRERGYNQVIKIIEEALSYSDNLTHMTLAPHILIRTRNTKPQTTLTRDERVQNVADAFGIRDPRAITDTHIVLIDDVMTTGSTVRAAKAALLPHHPTTLTCFTLAH